MKTAIEWLVDELKNNHGVDLKLYNEFNQAKEMEKEQIMDACNTGIFHGGQLISTGRQYYNETFNK